MISKEGGKLWRRKGCNIFKSGFIKDIFPRWIPCSNIIQECVGCLRELGELRVDKAEARETIHKGFLNPQTKCKLLFLLCVPNKSRRERPHRIFILPPQTEQLEKEGTGKQFRYILHSLSNSVCLPHQPLFLDFNSAQRKCYTSHSGSHL